MWGLVDGNMSQRILHQTPPLCLSFAKKRRILPVPMYGVKMPAKSSAVTKHYLGNILKVSPENFAVGECAKCQDDNLVAV